MNTLFKNKKNLLSCIITFILTTSIVIAIFIKYNIYPFGNSLLCFADYDQNYSFVAYFKDIFLAKNSFKYSLSNVLGSNMVGTFAFFCSSPLNLLLIIFKNDFLLGINIIIILRITLSALFFNIILNCLFDDMNFEKVLFSISYAFISYIIMYIWQLAWADAVMMLPMVTIGIINIIKKKKSLVYIISLSYTIISNYYTGYMVCIFTFIFYIFGIMFISKSFNQFLSNFKKTIVIYILSSMLAVGISAFLLLPTILSVPEGRRLSVLYVLSRLHSQFNLFSFINMFYTKTSSIQQSENLPFVFIGIIPFCLFITLFINKNIKLEIKLKVALLMLVIFFLFNIKALDLLMHGFTQNVFFNFRYSFAFSFCMLLISFYSLKYIEKSNIFLLKFIILYVLITFLATFANIVKPYFANVNTKAIDLIIGILGIALLVKINSKNKFVNVVLKIFICILIIGNLMQNAIYIFDAQNFDKEIVNKINSKSNEIMQIKSNESDNSIYRIGDANPFGRCDASLFNYYGVANYSSNEHYGNLSFAKRMGMEHAWMWGQYNDNAPLSSNILLGLKYIISKNKKSDDAYDTLFTNNDSIIYRNMYSMPFAFYTTKNEAIDYSNNFEIQNSIFKNVFNLSDDIFTKEDFDVNNKIIDGKIISELRIKCRKNNYVYIYIPAHSDLGDFYCTNSDGEKLIKYSQHQEVYNLGIPNVNGEIYLTFKFNYIIDLSDCFVYSQNEELVIDTAKSYLKNQDLDIKLNNTANIDILNLHSGHISTYILYDNNWKVISDGKELEKSVYSDFFLSFEVPEGVTSVKLIYSLKYEKLGIFISLLSIILTIIFIKKQTVNIKRTSKK